MAFSLDKIVPWGRSFEEYVRMFNLSTADLKSRILCCGDGPANFNSEVAKHGSKVLSIDPLYQYSAGQIRQRIDETYEQVMAQVLRNLDGFVWDSIKSPTELAAVRMAAMTDFLDDFEQHAGDGRYLASALPHLSLEEQEFDLALCSHLLFLYSEQLSLAFHRDSVIEMCRVAREVRVFPLFDLKGTKSRHLTPLINDLRHSGLSVAIEQVPYEFQRGANEMMKVCNPQSTHR